MYCPTQDHPKFQCNGPQVYSCQVEWRFLCVLCVMYTADARVHHPPRGQPTCVQLPTRQSMPAVAPRRPALGREWGHAGSPSQAVCAGGRSAATHWSSRTSLPVTLERHSTGRRFTPSPHDAEHCNAMVLLENAGGPLEIYSRVLSFGHVNAMKCRRS